MKTRGEAYRSILSHTYGNEILQHTKHMTQRRSCLNQCGERPYVACTCVVQIAVVPSWEAAMHHITVYLKFCVPRTVQWYGCDLFRIGFLKINSLILRQIY